MRIEDFLAAQGDHYPPVSNSPVSKSPGENKLVIRVAAGPSPLGEPGLRLLQVGVQAGRSAECRRAATDLTIAVDTSASMRHGRRLEMVRRGHPPAGERADARRPLTLIGFSDDAELLADHLRIDRLSADAADLRPSIDCWRPSTIWCQTVGRTSAPALRWRASHPGQSHVRDGNEPGAGDSSYCFRTAWPNWVRKHAAGSARSSVAIGRECEIQRARRERRGGNFRALADLAAAGEGHARERPMPTKSPPHLATRWPAHRKRWLAVLRSKSRSIRRSCIRIGWLVTPRRRLPGPPRLPRRSICTRVSKRPGCSNLAATRRRG